eukprot:gnl/Spiro4/16481_TR8865_c0_g1_i1.p1 gnl/Spiro4/16481_TR8865_c0_g1~~gnl/Spiro4/16481_TR8865_c0_g1_i1.p1  ORF type:complete len:356 (-),score=52.76 gnl/Spiro4/16481_TR8865_c0_g1_i1:60-1127(-)
MPSLVELILGVILLAGTALSVSVQSGRSFSGAVSQANATQSEQVLLNHSLSQGAVSGYVNNWWVGGPNDAITLSFYVDGEASASVVIDIANACGSGFDQAPKGATATYSSEYFSKLAATSGWSNKFPVPFEKSILVTFKSKLASPAQTTFWGFVRGVEDVPLRLSGVDIPAHARLQVQKNTGEFQPFTLIPVVRVEAGLSGLVLATMIAATSANLNFLEGCVYLYPDANSTWDEGMQLFATGTEDYFESSYYFDAGPVAGMYAGATIRQDSQNSPEGTTDAKMSMFKIHGAHDPLVFSNGMMLQWRIGDLNDSVGMKCRCRDSSTPGCTPSGSPQKTTATVYSYIYTWKSPSLSS